MALFRDGVKIGNKDIRTGISKKRGQGILRKLGVLEDDKGRKKFERDARGEMQAIRTLVGKAEGFQFPVNFKVSFGMPTGIQQPKLDKEATTSRPPAAQDIPASYAGPNKGQIKGGSLDWRTHIMNNSTTDLFKKRFDAAKSAASTTYKFGGKGKRDVSLLDLYCSKVTIPEKSITTGLYRHYGDPFPFPQNVMYGAITTTFYCDGTMHIKNYFDAWQKLIYNDMTGNFNYYDEYTAEFDVFTRTTIAAGANLDTDDEGGGTLSRAEKISQGIKDFTKELNDATGVEGPRGTGKGEDIGAGSVAIPIIDFRENYGVRVFECFPQNVGGIDLSHDATDSIATFDVTWSYRKWNPFKMGNIGNRSTVNLSVGEFRNEKDGFPFLEDLPEELSGPLTGAVNQGIVTGPMSNASNLLG